MRRALLLCVLPAVFGLATLFASGALAAETHSDCATFDQSGNIISLTPSCSQTVSQQGGQPQSQPGTNPCTGESGVVTLSFTHQIVHINVNGGGELWITGTQNGTATFTPDNASTASGQGSWASWFGGSVNERNAVFTDTFNVELHSMTGQTITMHEVGHTVMTPGGAVFSFDKPTGSCS